MNVTRLEKIYGVLLASIFGLIVVHAPLSVWLGTMTSDTVDAAIKSWKEILMAIALPMAVVIATKHRLWTQFKHDVLFYIICGYAALHIFIALVWPEGAATLAGIGIDLRYILFFALVYILVQAVPGWRPLLVRIGVAGALVVTVFAALQLFLPADILSHIGYREDTIQPYLTVDKNPNYIRINSTLRGPNPLGAYVAIVVSLVVALWLRGNQQIKERARGITLVLTVCSAVALWLSYSRSAWLAVIVALIAIAVVLWGKRINRNVWVTVIAAILIVVAGLFALRDTPFVANVILHENPSGGSSVSSNEQHAESLSTGVSRLLVQPFGAGVGSTGSASLLGDMPVIIENQYLFVAHEVGWLGLGLFMGICVLVLVRLRKTRNDWLGLGVFASGLGLMLIGLLQPVWADDTVSIIWWGLAAMAIGGTYGKR